MYSTLYSTLHSTRHCNAAKGAGGITHNGMNAATLLWLQHYAQHLLLRLQPFLRRRGMRLGDLRWCAGGHYHVRSTVSPTLCAALGGLAVSPCYSAVRGFSPAITKDVGLYCGTCFRTRRPRRMMYRPVQNGTCDMHSLLYHVPSSNGAWQSRITGASASGYPPRYYVLYVVLCRPSRFRDLLLPPRLCGLALMRQSPFSFLSRSSSSREIWTRLPTRLDCHSSPLQPSSSPYHRRETDKDTARQDEIGKPQRPSSCAAQEKPTSAF
jgi:hypothetical protein